MVLAHASDRETAARLLGAVAVGEVGVAENGRELTAAVEGGVRSLRHVLEGLEAAGLEVLDIGLRRPTLDDVFLSLTGHAAEKDPDENTDAAEEALR